MIVSFLFLRSARSSTSSRLSYKAAVINIPHLPEPDLSSFEEVIAAENESINRRDLFGTYMIHETNFNDEYCWGFDVDTDNPFTIFLRKLADSLDGLAEFEEWNGESVPDYSVCFDESAALVGGDRERAHEILEGLVALHEMPKEISQPEKSKERAAWVREKAQQTREEIDRQHKRWRASLPSTGKPKRS